MARIEGAQNIPSELKTLYDGALTPLMPNAVVRGRYPWEKPNKQLDGYGVTPAEKEQRERWLLIRDKFDKVDAATRERWYAARPIWNSLLWYYNYFIMSGLLGNAQINDKGAGVIKNISHYTFSLPVGTAPDATVAVTAVDPKKAVPFFFGAGYFNAPGNIPVAVYPYLKQLASTQMIIGGSLPIDLEAQLSVTLIEYI